MRESAFTHQNKEKWQLFEEMLRSKTVNPQVLSDLYVKITDDLSFAKTFYPDSKTSKYLNELASKVHHSIYKTKKERSNRLITFFRDEVPIAFASMQKQMLISFLIFMIAAGIGAISAYKDSTFLRVILGDSYVNMTINNIKEGKPFDVYAKMDPLEMFLKITWNNINVSFIAFALGITYGFGTVIVLFRNGVMLGSFFTFFFQYGLLGDSILTVMLHGTIEISAVVAAGGAGLAIGNSLLFPKTYTRIYALQTASKKGLKIIVGLIPLFIIAGFIEGFLTRYAGMPSVIKALVLLLSFVFILYYFVIYPRTKSNQLREENQIPISLYEQEPDYEQYA